MRRVLFLSLLLAAPSLFALEIIPPLVDSHTFVRVRFLAAGCVAVPHVAITGSTIRLISTDRPGFACVTIRALQPAVAEVGVLAAGVYNIETEGNEHATLVVRDAEAGFVVSPVGVAVTAGRIVQIFSDRPLAAPV